MGRRGGEGWGGGGSGGGPRLDTEGDTDDPRVKAMARGEVGVGEDEGHGDGVGEQPRGWHEEQAEPLPRALVASGGGSMAAAAAERAGGEQLAERAPQQASHKHEELACAWGVGRGASGIRYRGMCMRAWGSGHRACA